jgi:hypothetical protein
MPLRLKARSKYRAEPVVVDGVRFDSKGEFRRWSELVTLLRAGQITNLQRQLKIDLHVDRAGTQRLLGRYVADFAYHDAETNRLVLEDFKGHDTALSRWKRKHVEAQYGIPVLITRSKAR